MVPREDTDSEVVALQTGEVMAAFPQPFPGAAERLGGDLEFVGGGGTFIEGLWINQNAPDRRFEITRNIRQAVAYSLEPRTHRGGGARVDHRGPAGAAVRRLEPGGR